MVTKLGPLCKVKLLNNKADKAVVRSPEKAGVGRSTPSLATTFSITCKLTEQRLRSKTFQLQMGVGVCLCYIAIGSRRAESRTFKLRAIQLRGFSAEVSDGVSRVETEGRPS